MISAIFLPCSVSILTMQASIYNDLETIYTASILTVQNQRRK